MIDFERFARRKTRQATSAPLTPLRTIRDDSSHFPLLEVGSAWTRRVYDGPFHLFPAPVDMPAISLVFVQSQDGNTVSEDPGALGGGAVDTHLLYEGLSRVAADAVLAGAVTAAGEDVFFSVWHPELVALRADLGLPRHPVQMIVSGSGAFDVDRALSCNVPDVPAIVVTGDYGAAAVKAAAATRPWLTVVVSPDGDLRATMRTMFAEHGIRRISAVGGRRTATSLIDAGLVQDLCLTTSDKPGGEPNTPYYIGAVPPAFEPVLVKRGTDPAHPILFEHSRLKTKGKGTTRMTRKDTEVH